MFDIGFSELMVIALVALIVIGPERLPGVARTIGHLVGRLQRYIADVKADIGREIEFDDLRKMRDSFQEAASEVGGAVRKELSQHQQELNEAIGAGAPATPGEQGGASEAAPEPSAAAEAAHDERAEGSSVPTPAAREEAPREAAYDEERTEDSSVLAPDGHGQAAHETRAEGSAASALVTHEEAPREAAQPGTPADAVPAEANTPAATPETR